MDKPKVKRSAHVNISVPADLKKEMDKWPVNWSRIFAEAARKKLDMFNHLEKCGEHLEQNSQADVVDFIVATHK